MRSTPEQDAYTAAVSAARARAEAALGSASALAEALGVSRSALAHATREARVSWPIIVRLAELAALDPDERTGLLYAYIAHRESSGAKSGGKAFVRASRDLMGRADEAGRSAWMRAVVDAYADHEASR